MPTFVTARETQLDYIFEICDEPVGACHHGTDTHDAHRTYVFGRGKTIGDDWTMSMEQAVREVQLLEAYRAEPAAAAMVMPLEGQPVAPPLDD